MFRSAVQNLIDSIVPRYNISLVAADPNGEYRTYTSTWETKTEEGAAIGAIAGDSIGRVLGLLAGIGVLAIPGIGPVVAAGPLAAALGSGGAGAVVGAGIGAVTGGLVGALVGIGIPEEDANIYVEGVRRGGILVVVRTDDAMADRVQNILERTIRWISRGGRLSGAKLAGRVLTRTQSLGARKRSLE